MLFFVSQRIFIFYEDVQMQSAGGCSDAELIYQNYMGPLDCTTHDCTSICHSFSDFGQTSSYNGVVFQYKKRADFTDDVGFVIRYEFTGQESQPQPLADESCGQTMTELTGVLQGPLVVEAGQVCTLAIEAEAGLVRFHRTIG